MTSGGRRRCLWPAGALLALAGLALGACREGGPASSPPVRHVVLVTLDTLRADHLPLYGYPLDTAPNLARWAASSTVFERAYTTAPTTTPSHASLFSAVYPYEHGATVNGSDLRSAPPVLAETLRDAGFSTAAFVSVGFLALLDRGFSVFDAPAADESRKFRPGEETVDAARQWLHGRTDGERIFLWLHLFDVHEYADPEERYAPHADAVHPAGAARGPGMVELARRLHGFSPERYLEGDRPFPFYLRAYDGRIRYVDEQLGRLDEAVSAATGSEPVLWLVTADHGEGLGDHGYVGHGKFLYDEQLHVPLLVRRVPRAGAWPDRVATLVRHVDLAPTLLELAGAPPWRDVRRGHSLAPLLRGEPTGPATPAFAQRGVHSRRWGGRAARGGGWSMRDERFKWIVYSGSGPELFDLVADPREASNLADDPPAEALALRGELAGRLEELRTSPVAERHPAYLEQLEALGYLD